MRRLARRLAYCVLKVLGLYPYYVLRKWGYLVENGWYKSLAMGQSVDADAKPIPWISYSCLHFLESRLPENLSVFEYGSGNSTLWWAERARRVVACEHDQSWYARVSSMAPANVEVLYVPLDVDGRYCRQVKERSEKYDIIVIDGRDRTNCARHCIKALSKRGVILWDDSQSQRYVDGLNFLKSVGFRSIEFEGIKALSSCGSTASILYRPDNLLEI